MEQSTSSEAKSHLTNEESPACYETRRFITVFTTALHWFLSWARWTQYTSSHLISLRSTLILYSIYALGLPSGLFPSGFPTKILHAFLMSLMRATCPSHLILLGVITLIIFGVALGYLIPISVSWVFPKIPSNSPCTKFRYEMALAVRGC
jgi:hypothetical protein